MKFENMNVTLLMLRCNGYNECPPLSVQDYLKKDGLGDRYCSIPSSYDPASCLDKFQSQGSFGKDKTLRQI